MYKFMIAVLLGMFSLGAYAQEMGTAAPKAEIFGGYQYTRFDGGLNANGWDTSVTSNLNHWFGIGGDFYGAYKSESGVSFNTYTYAFGPVDSYRNNVNLTPFAHFLLAGFHSSVSASAFGFSASGSGLAMMLGGGFDVKATP